MKKLKIIWENLEISISSYIENANRYQDMENQGEIILYRKEVKWYLWKVEEGIVFL